MIIKKIFFQCPLIRELRKTFKGVSRDLSELAVLKIFLYSEGGIFFDDFKQMSKRVGIGIKISEQIWDFLVTNEVLKETEFGYTATPYLEKKGWIDKKKNDFEF